MLTSLALIILIGFALQGIFQKMALPGLLGLLLAGLILGPPVLNWLDADLLAISADLRKIALIVILVRAGLALDIRDLRLIGRPAVLLGFIPAILEIAGVVVLGPLLFHLSLLEAALLGTVLAAVSPAVVIPAMLRLQECGYGRLKRIPQMLIAGATLDNICVVLLFSALMSAAGSGDFHWLALWRIPASILTGIAAGSLAGMGLSWLFRKIHMRDTLKVLLILGLAFLVAGSESQVAAFVPFSGLLAVVALAAVISGKSEPLARRLSGKFGKVWIGAELVLFVLLGTLVDPKLVLQAGAPAVVLILAALACRCCGVWLSVRRSGISKNESTFCMIAYLPKASLQAVLGALPLAAGLPAGQLILMLAVLAILITAPLGAVGIEKTSRHLLQQSG